MNTNSFLTLPFFYINLGSLYLKKMKVSNHRAWNWSQRVETNLTVNKSAHCFWGDIEKYSFPLSSERLELTVPVQLFGRLYFLPWGRAEEFAIKFFHFHMSTPGNQQELKMVRVIVYAPDLQSELGHSEKNQGKTTFHLMESFRLLERDTNNCGCTEWFPSLHIVSSCPHT